MKKIIIFLITLLLISGCIPSSLPITKPSGVGIEVEIIKPVKQGKVYVDQPFNVMIKLTNKGESDAEDITTCITGLNQKTFPSFSGCECQESFKLEGKIEGEEGEEESLTFDIGTINPEGLKKDTVTAKIRYDYKTKGILNTCIKKADDNSKESCNIIGRNMLKSTSKSPLEITEVAEEIIKETESTIKIIFNIKLKNSVKGNLYSLDESKEQCRPSEDLKKNINLILKNAPGNWYCYPAELNKENEAIAQCIINNVRVQDESYETEDLTLEVEYAYETIVSNTFEVI